MRVLLIVNPFASSVTARGRVVIQKTLSADHDLSVVETNRRGHATRYAQDAAKRGMHVVAVLAGDGTLNEAANGLVGSGTALAALPGGSTNVFARTLGLPNEPVEAARITVEALAAGSIKPIGLGAVNGRFFLFHTGVGFDAAVVREVERRGSLKRWAGHPLFMYAGVTTWSREYRRNPPRFSVTLGDGSTVSDAAFAVFLNTNPYTFVGNRPIDLASGANLQRPLAVVILRDLGPTILGRTLWAAIAGTGVKPSKKLLERLDQEVAVVTSDNGVPYQVDGDDLGDARRLEFRWVPDAVRVVFPIPTKAAN